MDDDTIKNLISYGEEETSDNVENEQNGDTKKIEIPIEQTSEKDDEEAFEDDAADTDDTDTEYEEPHYEYEEYEEPHTPMMSRKKFLIISLTAVGIFLLMAVFSMIDTGAIGRYKKNFSANITRLFNDMGIDISKKPIPTVGPVTDTSAVAENSVSEDGKKEQIKVMATPDPSKETDYNTEVIFSKLIPFEGASESEFCAYKKGVICAKTNYLCYIGASGKIEWETATSVVDPILKAEGDYIFIAQSGGTKICLYNGNKLIYDTDTGGNILSCSVSSNGDAVTVMSKSPYKGAFSVYNKDGDEIYAWSSGSALIVSADISDSSRRVAASLLNTDSRVKSTIMLFNIKKEGSYAYAEFDDTVLFDLVFVDDNINAFGDNAMAGMNTSGKILYDKRFDDVELTNYSIDKNGTKIMAFNSGNIPMMNVYNNAGVLKYTVTLQSSTDYADINSYNIIYNDNRDVFLGKPNSKSMSKFTASMDIKDLILIDSRTFAIVYSNSIEFVKM